jgi:FixJ family two-component response regulator
LSYEKCVVLVLDDDPQVRVALAGLLCSSGLQVFTFASAEEFLQAKIPDLPSCLILDLELPGANGLDLQKKLAETDGPPIIFISGHGDIRSSVRAMKEGAVEFLPKPFSDQELFAAVDAAMARDRETKERKADVAEMQKLYARLTPREREVFPLIVAGQTNKQSAAKLGIAEITLQVHRAQIMRKMEAQSVPELVRMATRLRRALLGGTHTNT